MTSKNKNSEYLSARDASLLRDYETISKMTDYFRQPNNEELLNFIEAHARDPHAEIMGYREKDQQEREKGQSLNECDCR